MSCVPFFYCLYSNLIHAVPLMLKRGKMQFTGKAATYGYKLYVETKAALILHLVPLCWNIVLIDLFYILYVSQYYYNVISSLDILNKIQTFKQTNKNKANTNIQTNEWTNESHIVKQNTTKQSKNKKINKQTNKKAIKIQTNN